MDPSSNVAESEAYLRKLELERDKLQAELKILSEAISTREACEDLIRHIEKLPDPLAAEFQKDNPWTQTPPQQTVCCIIM